MAPRKQDHLEDERHEHVHEHSHVHLNFGLSPNLETLLGKLFQTDATALARVERKTDAVLEQGKINMAKIDDLGVAVQKHADAWAAFQVRNKADFDNLKAVIAAKGNIDAALTQMENTVNSGRAEIEAADADPDFPAKVVLPVEPTPVA